MIKLIENGIRIIIFFFIFWFFKNLITDINDFFVLTSQNDKSLVELQRITDQKEKEYLIAKNFYEENKFIIENAKISDAEIKSAIESVFKDITNKKLGFFKIQDLYFERDKKIINTYNINLSLILQIDSLFNLQDVDLMISKEIEKRINIFNKVNDSLFHLELLEKNISNNEYKIQLILINKWRKPNE